MTPSPDSAGLSPDDLPPGAVPLPRPKVARPLTTPPASGTVLVVAPHPDDEAIGPGATLVMHARAGDAVHALFVTSGVHGEVAGGEDPQAYVATRQREAEAAAEVLGIRSTTFWGYPDSMVVTDGDLAGVVDRLVALLEELKPAVVYAPHKGEAHSDHHYVALMVERALAAWDGKAAAYGYEVWSPLDADVAVDVASTYTVKLDAIRRYESQLVHNDICRAVDGLNRYRAVLLPPGGLWAEVFEEWRAPDGEAG